MALLVCAAAALAVGGCQSHLTPLNSTSQFNDFNQQAAQEGKPTMVMFCKGGCALCGMLEPSLDKLAVEYKDCARFGKYELVNFFWIVRNRELRDQYNIRGYPTVILFEDGKETKRWVISYNIRSYREALDKAISPPPQEPTTRPDEADAM